MASDLPGPSIRLPIDGVIFDFHSTLVDQGKGREWVHRAWRLLDADSPPEDTLGADGVTALATVLDRIWEGARAIDPDNARDLDPAQHRAVFGAVLQDLVNETVRGSVEPLRVIDALYSTVTDLWTEFSDTLPTLRTLRLLVLLGSDRVWPRPGRGGRGGRSFAAVHVRRVILIWHALPRPPSGGRG